MKLLIIGAGGHGQAVAEIAESLGYDEIAFLDDNYADAIGNVNDIEKFKTEYDSAFVGIGNNKLRAELIKKLEEIGYLIPILIHPTAYVSKTAQVGRGVVVAPMSAIHSNTIVGEGCIISVGALVDHNAVVGAYSHIDAGAIIKSGGSVEMFTKIEAGQVVSGY